MLPILSPTIEYSTYTQQLCFNSIKVKDYAVQLQAAIFSGSSVHWE